MKQQMMEQPVIEDLMRRARRAVQRWANQMQGEGQLEHEVTKRLDARLTEIVGALLGFRTGWGSWEVDHCNGRAGESAVGDWLRKRAGKAVQAWLTQQAEALPDLPLAARAALRRGYLERYEKEMRRILEEAAVRNAARDVSRYIDVLTGGKRPAAKGATQ